jgi:hypothetical protein
MRTGAGCNTIELAERGALTGIVAVYRSCAGEENLVVGTDYLPDISTCPGGFLGRCQLQGSGLSWIKACAIGWCH